MENQFTTQENKNGFDIRLEFNKYLPFWFWFVGFTAATLFIAHFYLRYSPPVFQNSAKIKILDNSNSPFKMSTEGIFIVGKNKAKLGNDLQIIKSKIATCGWSLWFRLHLCLYLDLYPPII